ncbi:hypothetical protein EDD15DRAFT_2369893 [Pisolithus albus]|nr:hypothetical protein EDD15DRAFT_2369893 [Pisolithus albus]
MSTHNRCDSFQASPLFSIDQEGDEDEEDKVSVPAPDVPIPSADGGSEATSEVSPPQKSAAVSEAFSFQLFPLTNEKNRAELLALKSTHRIVPLPAYDFSKDIIRPGAYWRLLQGAVVEVHFTLSHWGIATAKRDVYGGNIEKIRLLVLPTSSSSKKRKVTFHLDSEDMPTQKLAKMDETKTRINPILSPDSGRPLDSSLHLEPTARGFCLNLAPPSLFYSYSEGRRNSLGSGERRDPPPRLYSPTGRHARDMWPEAGSSRRGTEAERASLGTERRPTFALEEHGRLHSRVGIFDRDYPVERPRSRSRRHSQGSSSSHLRQHARELSPPWIPRPITPTNADYQRQTPRYHPRMRPLSHDRPTYGRGGECDEYPNLQRPRGEEERPRAVRREETYPEPIQCRRSEPIETIRRGLKALGRPHREAEPLRARHFKRARGRRESEADAVLEMLGRGAANSRAPEPLERMPHRGSAKAPKFSGKGKITPDDYDTYILEGLDPELKRETLTNLKLRYGIHSRDSPWPMRYIVDKLKFLVNDRFQTARSRASRKREAWPSRDEVTKELAQEQPQVRMGVEVQGALCYRDDSPICPTVKFGPHSEGSQGRKGPERVLGGRPTSEIQSPTLVRLVGTETEAFRRRPTDSD